METPRPRPRRVVSRRRYRVRVAAVASVVDSRARALGGERRAERKTLGRALHRGVVERAGRSFHRGRVQGSLRDGVHVLRVPGVRRRGRGRVGLGGADGRRAVDVRYVRRGTRFGGAIVRATGGGVVSGVREHRHERAERGVSGVGFGIFGADGGRRARDCVLCIFRRRGGALLLVLRHVASGTEFFGGGRRGRVDDVGTSSGGRGQRVLARGTVTIGRVFRARRLVHRRRVSDAVLHLRHRVRARNQG